MEPICENRFSITKSLFFEGTRCLYREGYGKTARKYSLLFLLVWAVMAAFLLITGGTLGQTLVYLLLVAAICLWLNVLIPYNQGKRGWKALVCRYGDSLERRTCFYADHLVIGGDCAEKIVPYGEILEIKESRQLLVLVCADQVGVLIAKDGFVSGSAAQIRELIR